MNRPLVPAERRALSLRDQVGDEAALQLSAQQLELWSAGRLGGGAGISNFTHAELLDGPVDIEALRLAWRALVARHEALYTGVGARRPEPIRLAPERADLTVVHHTAAPAAQAISLAVAAARKSHLRDFDLEAELPVRLSVVELAKAQNALVLTAHRFAVDGVSLEVLFEELAQLYEVALSGGTALPPVVAQSRHLAHWQLHGAQAEQRLNEDRVYWRRRLADAHECGAFPADAISPAEPRFRGAGHSSVLPHSQLASLRALARSQRTSLCAVVLSALALALGRASRRDDVLIATSVPNRMHEDAARVVGCFANTLPVRVDLRGVGCGRDLVAAVSRRLVEDLSHQGLSFTELASMAKLPQGPFQGGLRRLVLLFRDSSTAGLRLAGTSGQLLELPHETARTEITIDVQSYNGGLRMLWEYSTELFSSRTIAAFDSAFRASLAALADSPQACLANIALAPGLPAASERRFADEDVWSRFNKQVHALPDAIAVEAGEADLSYSRLSDEALRWAARLHSAGVRAGDRVALHAARCPAWIAAVLGLFRIGASYVPIDTKAPAARVEEILLDSGCAAAIIDRHHRLPVASAPTRTLLLDADGPDAIDAVDAGATALPPHRACGDTPAYVMYTSGSTGRPKGVVVPHRGILRLVVDSVLMGGEGARVAFMANVAFDNSTLQLWFPLMNGGCVVVGPEAVASGDIVRDLVRRHRVNYLFPTTALFNMLTDVALDSLAGLRYLVFGGEAASPPHVTRTLQAHPQLVLINGYGPTENTCLSLVKVITSEGAAEAPTPIGSHLRGSHGYVVDRYGHQVPPGMVGELMVGGEGLALGYLGRPDLTAERFIPDPWVDGERMYRTGDLVREHRPGEFLFIGREDAQVKLSGIRVELGEIEHALTTLPGVAVAAVVVTPRTKRLVAFAVRRSEYARPLDEDGLREGLRSRLLPYMVPERIVELERMPLNNNGKCDRPALLASSEDALAVDSLAVAPKTAAAHASERELPPF